MTIKLVIFQGDSSDTVQTSVFLDGSRVVNLIADGYTGTFSIVAKLGDTPLLTETMVEIDSTFRATLLSDDTDTIPAGTYVGVIQIKNAGLDYRKEEHIKVQVNQQGYQEP